MAAIPPRKLLATHTLGDIAAQYYAAPEGEGAAGGPSLCLQPVDRLDEAVEQREELHEPSLLRNNHGQPGRAFQPFSLVQVHVRGDEQPFWFAGGHTLCFSGTQACFVWKDQKVEEDGETVTVVTTLADEGRGLIAEHCLVHAAGEAGLRCTVTVRNTGKEPVRLDLLASFCLEGLTPFAGDDGPGRLVVHRARSFWSSEGQMESVPAERLGLEPSWAAHAILSERFGQVGSMPVRRWFPFCAVEDAAAGVTWAARLAWAGSWQMELLRKSDSLVLCGGLADREFGHWSKTLAPGEALTTPEAHLTACSGDIEVAAQRLNSLQERAADDVPERESDLPICFNEWCANWGQPSHEKMVAYAKRLKGSEVEYVVIDAGWYASTSGWVPDGDWTVDERKFPHGLQAACEAIAAEGFTPGLWFEMEILSKENARGKYRELALHRDGAPIVSGPRAFWDLRRPEAHAHLATRVIETLRACGAGYLKVDYNETIGLGADHPDGPGEGLREHILGAQAFWQKLRAELPELTIENCSSGGHRLEPSMQALASMGSFSDAHETPEIPLIAANLHLHILPRQSLVWAVLWAEDSPARTAYSMAATFLGRMCLSGAIEKLSPAQWESCLAAQRLYRRAAPVITRGFSRIYRSTGPSLRHPTGWQVVVREQTGGGRVLVVAHTFAKAPCELAVPLPEGPAWDVVASYGNADNPPEARVQGPELCLKLAGDFEGAVFLLET